MSRRGIEVGTIEEAALIISEQKETNRNSFFLNIIIISPSPFFYVVFRVLLWLCLYYKPDEILPFSLLMANYLSLHLSSKNSFFHSLFFVFCFSYTAMMKGIMEHNFVVCASQMNYSEELKICFSRSYLLSLLILNFFICLPVRCFIGLYLFVEERIMFRFLAIWIYKLVFQSVYANAILIMFSLVPYGYLFFS